MPNMNANGQTCQYIREISAGRSTFLMANPSLQKVGVMAMVVIMTMVIVMVMMVIVMVTMVIVMVMMMMVIVMVTMVMTVVMAIKSLQ